MTYALGTGISFCVIEDRYLFLDLYKDRYFCLTRDAEQAFACLCRGGDPDPADRRPLPDLVARGLLVEGADGAPLVPIQGPGVATRSLLDETSGRASRRDVAAALLHLGRAPLELRAAGFAGAIARLRRRKARADNCIAPARIVAVAAAFRACARWVRANDRCLPRSLAVANRLVRLGARPDLVIGVKLAPFKAHAWVQWGELLVNERADVTRLFTPILVV